MKKNNPCIFIVDDDRRFNRFVELYLLKRGFKNVRPFFTGEDCIRNRDPEPDIIILDYHLDSGGSKIKTGLQVAEVIKKEFPATYIIMLSGEIQHEPKRFTDPRFINYIDRYLVKGMNNITELIDAVNESSF
jgi:DNA-binding response OmpR family regulator